MAGAGAGRLEAEHYGVVRDHVLDKLCSCSDIFWKGQRQWPFTAPEHQRSKELPQTWANETRALSQDVVMEKP